MARLNEYPLADNLTNKNLLAFSSQGTFQISSSILISATVVYFDTLAQTAYALRYNDFSEASTSLNASSKIKLSTSNGQVVLDLLGNLVVPAPVGILNSLIFNTNGFDIELQGDSLIGFAESAESQRVDVVMNCKGSTIFRTGTQTASYALIQVTCSAFTLNDCNINGYSSSEGTADAPLGGCTGVSINRNNNISTINRCNIRIAGRYSAYGVRVTAAKQINLNDCICVCGALFGHSKIYDPDQSLSNAVYISRGVEEVNIYNGTYSAECMAAQFGSTKTVMNGVNWESCDHGVYFVGESASVQACNFKHVKWSSLLCASIEYPFKEGVVKTKSQYTTGNPNYGNYGMCYIGSPQCEPKVAFFNCTESTDNATARINLSTNYSYKNNYCLLSQYTAINPVRVDGIDNGPQSHLIIGRDVTIPATSGNGYVNTTDFIFNNFYSPDNIPALVEIIKLKNSLGG